MKYFVYYHDNNGDENEGLEQFDTEEDACDFIQQRLPSSNSEYDKPYTVIAGREVNLVFEDIATRVRFGS